MLGGEQFYVFKENCLQLPFDFTTSDEEMRYADCGLFITLCRSGSCPDMAAMFMFDNAMLYSTQYSTLCLNEKKTVVSAFSKYCNIVKHPSFLAYMSGPPVSGDIHF